MNEWMSMTKSLRTNKTKQNEREIGAKLNKMTGSTFSIGKRWILQFLYHICNGDFKNDVKKEIIVSIEWDKMCFCICFVVLFVSLILKSECMKYGKGVAYFCCCWLSSKLYDAISNTSYFCFQFVNWILYFAEWKVFNGLKLRTLKGIFKKKKSMRFKSARKLLFFFFHISNKTKRWKECKKINLRFSRHQNAFINKW